TIHADEEPPRASTVEVPIAAASIDTGVADRAAHLRSTDFPAAASHPTISFRSTKAEGQSLPAGGTPRDGQSFRLVGDLDIRGTSIQVILDCVFEGRGKDPWGKDRVGFTAKGELDRREWGLMWNQAIETGGVLVANKVRVEAEVQFVRQD